MMKTKIMSRYLKIMFVLSTLFISNSSASQHIDWVNAPVNPIGYKWQKEHFNLKGDIYSSNAQTFSKEGYILNNYGTEYYYENGNLIGNNYGDSFKKDTYGNITEVVLNGGVTSQYTYNTKNLLIKHTNSYGDTYTHTYDANNRVITTRLDKKDQSYQIITFTYKKEGKTLIVSKKNTYSTGKIYQNVYYYMDGRLVQEEADGVTYKYKFILDDKGNQINFFEIDKPNAPEFKNTLRYYDEKNNDDFIQYGYSAGVSDKYPTVFLNGVKQPSIVVAQGIKPNEKVAYDGLKNVYYSIPDVLEDVESLDFKKPITEIISRNNKHISYAFDGKFINYVNGKNSVNSREFAFIGPHMIDYRVDRTIGITYIIDNYQNIKDKPVKPMHIFTRDTSSVVYLRELTKDNFFIVVKGKHIDYKKARFEYLDNGDPVIFIDDIPKYVLTGFKNAADNKVMKGVPYTNELEKKQTSNRSDTQHISTSTTTQIPKTPETNTSDYNCVEGDCKNGWGKITVNDIITDATFIDGAINGVAYISYPNGAYYHGEYKANRRSGMGYYQWDTGNSYIGYWKNGKQHGLGFTMSKDGQITSGGLFEDGKLIRDDSINYREGKTNGSCMGNCSDGFGRYTYNNGDKYWGFFKENQRFAVGTYLWNNNSMYTGAYTLGGARNGYGAYTYVDRSVFKGYFTEDKIDGLGVMKYNSSGNVVTGFFNNKGAKIKDY